MWQVLIQIKLKFNSFGLTLLQVSLVNFFNCNFELEIINVLFELSELNGLIIFHIVNEVHKLLLSIDHGLSEVGGSWEAFHHN